MSKKKILVVTGTRAEYGQLRSTMDAIRAHHDLDLKLLVTGMHTLKSYGNTHEEIKKDGYTIDSVVPVREGGDMLQNLSQEIDGIRNYCMNERPDCVLVLGDRDEPFAAAIVATHLNIPVAHIHGGDKSGPSVDESIRHTITKMAHIHFPGTHKSALNIRAMGEEPWRIFEIGTVVLDILEKETLFDRTRVAQELHLDPVRAWLTVVQHPVAFASTTLPEQITPTIRALENFPEYEKIVLYPNSDTGTEIFVEAIQTLKGSRYHVVKSLPRDVYMSAVKESDALIGNSSAGMVETSHLGTPTVDIGDRQKGREHGESVIHASYNESEIVRAIHSAIELKKKQDGKAFSSPYGKTGAGARIAEVLARELSRPELLNKQLLIPKEE